MTNKVLVVDDEKLIVKGIKFSLEQDGMEVTAAYDGKEAYELAMQNDYDIILLDVMLPELNGFEVCQMIREKSDVPIIMLTAKGDDMDKILGLEYGADDYITKPFLPQELLLRLRAVLRRVYREQPSAPRLGRTEIDWGKGTVRRDGREIPLTAKEFALLNKLWEARGNIVTIDALCAALWDGPLVGYENTLMVHIRHIREKMKDRGEHPRYIQNVWGVGYKLGETL